MRSVEGGRENATFERELWRHEICDLHVCKHACISVYLDTYNTNMTTYKHSCHILISPCPLDIHSFISSASSIRRDASCSPCVSTDARLLFADADAPREKHVDARARMCVRVCLSRKCFTFSRIGDEHETPRDRLSTRPKVWLPLPT